MTATDKKTYPTFLDPEFIADLKLIAANYDKNQEQADDDTWNIARRVNEMWQEHKSITHDGFTDELVYPTKLDFLSAVSYEINQGLKKPRFSASGETLRRWCEVQARYSNFKEADLFLEALSFEHLRIAKVLDYNGKVANPVTALAMAQKENWTADEMRLHYDPPGQITIYEKFTGWLESLWTTKLEFIKKVEDREQARKLMNELRNIMERNR